MIDEVGLTANRQHVLPAGNAPEYPARLVREVLRPVVARPHLVGVLVPGRDAAPIPAPISTPLTALIDIIAAARSARACRRPARQGRLARPGHHLDHRAGDDAGLSQAVEVIPEMAARGSGGERVPLDLGPVEAAVVDVMRADLGRGAGDFYAGATARATAPAATRAAVSRAEDRPPPRDRGSRISD